MFSEWTVSCLTRCISLMRNGSGIGTFDPGAIMTRSLIGSPSPSTASQFHFQVSRTQRTLFQLQR
eukprot:2645212-Prymnesium_polylepis.1